MTSNTYFKKGTRQVRIERAMPVGLAQVYRIIHDGGAYVAVEEYLFGHDAGPLSQPPPICRLALALAYFGHDNRAGLIRSLGVHVH
jgi:hypothetical protein